MFFNLKNFDRDFYNLNIFGKNYKVYFSLKSKAFIDKKYDDTAQWANLMMKFNVEACTSSIYSILITNEYFCEDFCDFESFLKKFSELKEIDLNKYMGIFNQCFLSSKPPEVRKGILNDAKKNLKIMKKTGQVQ